MTVFFTVPLGTATCLTLLSPLHAQEIRELKIIAAVSSGFKKTPGWRKEIRDRIVFANDMFDKQFGIHFSVKSYESWEPQDETREAGLLLEELRSSFSFGPDEVLIGFHQMSQPLSRDVVVDIDTVGTAQFFRGVAVLRDPFEPIAELYRNVVMSHELGHLFGAVHVSESDQIMSPSVSQAPTLIMDEDNRQIIQSTRGIDFQKGVDSLPDETIDELIRIYERLIRKNPHSDFYYHLGHFYKKRDQMARAVAIWEEAIRYHYDNPHIHRELGFYYHKNGRYDQAIQELGSAIAHFILPSQQGDRAMTLNYLGAAYYQKGHVEQAMFTWLKGLSVDPDNRDLQGNLAAAYLETGNLERGISELEKLVAKSPDDATCLSNLGVAYLKKKEYSKAVEFFQTALRVISFPSQNMENGPSIERMPEATLRLNLGAAYLQLGRSREAVEELEKSRQLQPDGFEVHRELAQAYLATGAHESAVKEIQEALRYKTDDPYLYAFLGQAYFETGNAEEAFQSVKDGLKYAQDPGLQSSLRKNLALLYAKNKNFPEALVELKSALTHQWNDPETHTRLGYVYLQMGKGDDARRSFETALRVDPKYEAAKAALEKIK